MRIAATAEAPRTVTGEHYTRTAVALHWTIAGLILLNLPIGLYCHLVDSPFEQALMNLHKPIGITVLGLSLARLGWRLWHRPPPLPITMPRRDQALAVAVHWLLYALMIGVPLAGWWMTSAFPGRHPIIWLGLEVPFLPVETGLQSAFVAHDVHSWLAIALTLLAGAHIAAAVRHRRLNDGLFDRMWHTHSVG